MANEVDEIKQRLDLVEVVKEYLPLKKAGTNFTACCPFHQEKTPSFMVSQTKQIWHCFGCHEGGDLFTFVQKIEGIEFYETLKILAERAGVTLKEQKGAPTGKKQRLLECVEAAAEFFHAVLMKHPKAEAARAYAKERGLTEATLKQFVLGYAPDAWDGLMKYLSAKGFSQQEIVEAGLLVVNQDRKSVYDRFRDRFMIPLCDVHGAVVGFTARALGENFQGGKYINTPQTLLYDKSRVIFGLSLARQAIKAAGYAVLVEGNMDVISSHQAGITPVVAVSGTALTPAQVGLLKRYTQVFIFAFDADDAGFHASLRGIQLALQQGIEVRLLTLPFGKDPDECIRKDVQLWKAAIEQAKPVIDVLLERADVQSVEGKKLLADRCVAILKYIQNPVERDHYSQKVALVLQVSPSSLQELLQRESVSKASQPSQEPAHSVKKEEEKQPYQEAAKELISLCILEPSLFEMTSDLSESFGEGSLADLYKNMKVFYDQGVSTDRTPDFSELLNQLPPALQTIYTHLELYGDMKFPDMTPQQRRDAFQARANFLLRHTYQTRLAALQSALQQAERQSDRQKIAELSAEFSRLSQALIHLES